MCFAVTERSPSREEAAEECDPPKAEGADEPCLPPPAWGRDAAWRAEANSRGIVRHILKHRFDSTTAIETVSAYKRSPSLSLAPALSGTSPAHIQQTNALFVFSRSSGTPPVAYK